MRFCTECGSKLGDGAMFCSNCGTKCQVQVEEPKAEPAAGAEPEIIAEPAAVEPAIELEPAAEPIPQPEPEPEPQPAPAPIVPPPEPSRQTPPPPSPAQILDPAPASNSRYSPVSAWRWVGIYLLLGIPLVGFILTIVWACGGCKRVNVRNMARGMLLYYLLWFAIALIVFIVFAIIAIATGATLAAVLQDLISSSAMY